MADMNKILPIILVALVLISAVQAFQLNSMKEKIDSGKISATATKSPLAGAVTGSQVASSGASGGASISDLPTMVGGC